MDDKKIHPVRGVIGGILFGLGLAMLLGSLGVVAFGTTMLFVVMAIGFVAVVLWSILGPARNRGSSASTS